MKAERGFTIIEIGITLVVLAVALSIAMPSYDRWISKVHVRNSADSVLAGLQLARSEAIKQNNRVCLRLTGGTGWSVIDNLGNVIQAKPSLEGDTKAAISITQPATITPFDIAFSGLGRQTNRCIDNSAPSAVSLSFSNQAATECTSAGPVGCFVIVVSLGGLIRMCDPSKPAGDPRAC